MISQDAAALPATQTVPVLALPMRWSQALRSCALPAVVAAVAMVFKLVVPLIAIVAAGFFAVVLYRRDNPGIEVRASFGARLGALCGFLCSAITGVLGALRVAVLHQGDQIRRTLLEMIQQSASGSSDPQLQPAWDFMRSSAGLVMMMVFLLIAAFLIFLILGTLGGVLGGAILGRRDR